MYQPPEGKESKRNLCNFSKKNRIDILGIVDHKIIHDNPIEHYEKQNVTFITTCPPSL